MIHTRTLAEFSRLCHEAIRKRKANAPDWRERYSILGLSIFDEPRIEDIHWAAVSSRLADVPETVIQDYPDLVDAWEAARALAAAKADAAKREKLRRESVAYWQERGKLLQWTRNDAGHLTFHDPVFGDFVLIRKGAHNRAGEWTVYCDGIGLAPYQSREEAKGAVAWILHIGQIDILAYRMACRGEFRAELVPCKEEGEG